MVEMGFQPGSLALSASIIREDKEASFCPLTAIEEQRASHKAKQRALMCLISPPIHVGMLQPIVYRGSTGKSQNRKSQFKWTVSGFERCVNQARGSLANPYF
jgi:hypothetical protein